MKNKDQVQNMLAERYNKICLTAQKAHRNFIEIQILEEVLRYGDEKISTEPSIIERRDHPDWSRGANSI